MRQAILLVILAACGVAAGGGHCARALNVKKGKIFGRKLKGEILAQGDEGYPAAAEQYASLAYAARIKPSVIVMAENRRDVVLAVRYATVCNWKVAIRSGGHQYSGLSSCNSDEGRCIQIDVSRLDKLEIDGTSVVTGPGVRLIDFYEALEPHGIFLSGGTCQGVNVGGHVQTGGIGAMTKAYGPLADSVVAFTIVLAGRARRSVFVMKVTKPGSGTTKFNDRLWHGVIGGAAGNFGVVVEYEFEAHKDSDHVGSATLSCFWKYTPELQKALMRGLKEIHEIPGVYEDRNFQIVLSSVKRPASIGGTALVLKAMWAAFDNKPLDTTLYDKVKAAGFAIAPGLCTVDPMPMSRMSRTTFMVTQGQDILYPFPYDKRHRYSYNNFDDDFIEDYVNRQDVLMQDLNNNIFIIAVFSFGGGAMWGTPPNGLPHRNHKFYSLTDLFAATPEALQTAIKFHDELYGSMDNGNVMPRDRLMMWGTFGDLNMETAWPKYFDDEAHYKRMTCLKKTVDPRRVFAASSFSLPGECN